MTQTYLAACPVCGHEAEWMSDTSGQPGAPTRTYYRCEECERA